MKLGFGFITGALISTVLSLVHRIPQDNIISKRAVLLDNFSGFGIAAPPAGSTFVAVQGTFVVPTIGEDTEKDSAVSIWVGIDGYMPMTAPLIQAGVFVEYADDGSMIYSAFTEWINDLPVRIDPSIFSVAPGDTVTVEVAGGTGAATATALFSKNGSGTTPVTITPTDRNNVIRGQNIEWIVERLDPANPEDANLLDFGTITFTDCSGSTAMQAAAFTPTDGDAIYMQDSEGGTSATAVANGPETRGFTVTWLGS